MIGRFLSVDPVSADPNSGAMFNRYNYAANNPYRFTDPDGRMIRNIDGSAPWENEGPFRRQNECRFCLSKDKGAGSAAGKQRSKIVDGYKEVAETAVNAALDGYADLMEGVAVALAIEVVTPAGAAAAGGKVVQRWMSKAELKAMQKTGLLRGGRAGTHYVTDAANADPLRARQRLALPQTPEVRATMEVPGNVLSAPTRAEPMFNMPGGGIERTATGDVPVRIIGVD